MLRVSAYSSNEMFQVTSALLKHMCSMNERHRAPLTWIMKHKIWALSSVL